VIPLMRMAHFDRPYNFLFLSFGSITLILAYLTPCSQLALPF
jgi:hypothetical protein